MPLAKGDAEGLTPQALKTRTDKDSGLMITEELVAIGHHLIHSERRLSPSSNQLCQKITTTPGVSLPWP